MNRNRIGSTIAALAVLALPALALAAEHAEAGEPAPGPHDEPLYFTLIQYISAIVVFLLVFGVLAKVAWPKILGGLDERANKIRSEIFAAEESRKKAADAAQQHLKELAAARAEATKMIEAAKGEQVRAAADLRAQAEAELTQLRESAMRSIEAAKRAALADIYSQTAELATTCASQILQRELNPQDQARLIEPTLAEFGRQYSGKA